MGQAGGEVEAGPKAAGSGCCGTLRHLTERWWRGPEPSNHNHPTISFLHRGSEEFLAGKA
jgi:hypothetical protein